MAVTSGEETELNTAATETLREEFLEVWTQGFDEIVGGTDLLAAAFAARLRSRIHQGAVVTTISQYPERKRAAAIFREGSAERRVEGDFLLCTLPFSVLSRVRVEPDWSGP